MNPEAYIHAFSKLNVNRSGEHVSPHKPVMLLAVLALAEAGLLKENKIGSSGFVVQRISPILVLL